MECNKLRLEKRFLKVRVKVTGFLIAKIEKRNTPEQVIIAKKRNTILTTGLQNLLNAFQTYMSGVAYLGVNAPSTGIVITTSSGVQFTLSFLTPPPFFLDNNSIILSFTVRDDTTSFYTATSEELITTSAGYNIPIATANLSVTKNSDEILTMTWVITISVSPSGNILYIQTPQPQEGGWNCQSGIGSCNSCIEVGANSQLPNIGQNCPPFSLTSQYPQTSYITSQLFGDIFYNKFSAGTSNSFTSYLNTTLYIYTLYCIEYFIAGYSGSKPFFVSYNGNTACYLNYTGGYYVYLQVYFPYATETYIGVQIEFTT